MIDSTSARTKRRLAIRSTCIATLLAALLTSVGCGRNEEPAAPGRRGGDRVVTVETTEVRQREWQRVARAVGSLAADEHVRVRNEIEGVVREIHANEGDWVEAGQQLVTLDDERARLEVQRAEARHHEAQALLQRRKPLHEQNLITEAELITAQAAVQTAEAELGLARRRLADATVRAPIEGQLGRRHISTGNHAPVGTALFDLVKLDVLKLDVELPERYLASLEIGQTVRLRSATHPDRRFSGTVYFIDPLINPATRSIPVRARIDNEDLALRPNLFVNVELDVELIEAAVVVPEEAIIADMGGFTVYVVDADDRAEIRQVRLGEREPGWIQILEGVEPGERLVRVGHQRLQPGMRIRDRGADGE